VTDPKYPEPGPDAAFRPLPPTPICSPRPPDGGLGAGTTFAGQTSLAGGAGEDVALVKSSCSALGGTRAARGWEPSEGGNSDPARPPRVPRALPSCCRPHLVPAQPPGRFLVQPGVHTGATVSRGRRCCHSCAVTAK
jgi:hypothetical protein